MSSKAEVPPLCLANRMLLLALAAGPSSVQMLGRGGFGLPSRQETNRSGCDGVNDGRWFDITGRDLRRRDRLAAAPDRAIGTYAPRSHFRRSATIRTVIPSVQ